MGSFLAEADLLLIRGSVSHVWVGFGVNVLPVRLMRTHGAGLGSMTVLFLWVQQEARRPPSSQNLVTCWGTCLGVRPQCHQHPWHQLLPASLPEGWAFHTHKCSANRFPKDSQNFQVYLAFLGITPRCAVCGSDFLWGELEVDIITRVTVYVYILAPAHCKILHFTGIILGPGSRMLFIERVKEEDEGLYQCIATNLKGSVESTAYVTVQGKARRGMGRASQPGGRSYCGWEGWGMAWAACGKLWKQQSEGSPHKGNVPGWKGSPTGNANSECVYTDLKRRIASTQQRSGQGRRQM